MPFALNPAAAVDGIIDFDMTSNVKFHRRATTKLEGKIYDFVPQDLSNFLELLNDRATAFQWSEKVGIMMIPKDVSYRNTDYVNLLTNHGYIILNIIIIFE